MVTATRDQIGDALDWEITDWRETQRSAIRNITWPSISGNTDLFKTAAMFNLGVDATKTIYPTSVVTGVITSASVHLFILKQAQVAFTAQYQAHVARANTELQSQFTVLADSFISKIQDTSRNFKNSPTGRAMAEAIFTATTGIEFRDDAQRDALLRQLIRDAELIETDAREIREKTNQGIGRLSTKIRDLWRASYHDPMLQDANMYFSGSFQRHMGGSGSTSQRWHRVRRRVDQDWVIRNAWRMDVQYVRIPSFNDRDRCNATLIEGRDNTQTHTGVTIAPGALRSAIANMNRSIQRQ